MALYFIASCDSRVRFSRRDLLLHLKADIVLYSVNILPLVEFF